MRRGLAGAAGRGLVTLGLAAAVAAPGCAGTQEPLPPSEAALLAAETRAAAGLPPSSETEPPAAPEEPAVPAATPPPEASAPPPPALASEAAASGEAVAVSRLVEEKEDAAAAGAPDDPTVVEISRGRVPEEPKTLAEAAAAAREKRRREGRPRATLVIDNDNLAAFAAGGQVTVMAPGTAAPPAGESATGAEAGAAPAEAGPRDEAYWRDRARDLRTRWADAAREVERLEDRAAQLRWDFYAEDDPYYRDERIKPEWDRALDELRRARQDVRAYREDLAELIEEGHQAGALPGWLREGVELEPEEGEEPSRARRTPGEAEVEEPTVYGAEERP